MDIIQNLVVKDKDFLEKCFDGCKSIEQECDSFFKEIDKYLTSNDADFFKQMNIGKENVEPNKRRGRQRKPVLTDITENNLLSTGSLRVKKEKLSEIYEKHGELNAQVKKEAEDMPAPTKLPPRKKRIKVENVDLPKRSTRTRTMKCEDNGEIISDHESIRSTKDSDVIIQNTTITTIDITDSEKDGEAEVETEKSKHETVIRNTRSKMRNKIKAECVDNIQKDSLKESSDADIGRTIRTTRTKTKQKKRVRSNSTEQSSQTERKKSKSNSDVEQESNGTYYEDAVSLIENNQNKPQDANATFIASSKNSQIGNENPVASTLNLTVVIEKPNMVTNQLESPESCKPPQNGFEEAVTSPKPANKKGAKQIFSPFEKTPLKKKVEAFEKFGAESSGIPTRVTRTIKKTQKNDAQKEIEIDLKLLHEKNKKSVEREKSKTVTPVATKFIPKVCSTSKISKLHPVYSNDISTSNESMSSVRSASALKASQAEFREREKRKQEKEREALKKREALLKAQTEEKRRKREEKQLKAQQQREMIEKEKQKQLEAQRIKEEKFKQAMAEREEKLLKQKEEAEKKRLIVVKNKAELLKEKEELIRIAEQKKNAETKAVLEKEGGTAKLPLKHKMERGQQHPMPVYMVTKPPLLPTVDCYDSDDPEYGTMKKYEPAWSRGRDLEEMQLAILAAGDTIKNSFFCRQAQTPDLQEIFEIIDPRKLKRTSSAIWRKPPRYTLMPTLEDTLEFSEDSD